MRDILPEKGLREIAKNNPDQFKFHLIMDMPSSTWDGRTGYVLEEYIEKNMFGPDADNIHVFVCGPPSSDQGCLWWKGFSHGPR